MQYLEVLPTIINHGRRALPDLLGQTGNWRSVPCDSQGVCLTVLALFDSHIPSFRAVGSLGSARRVDDE